MQLNCVRKVRVLRYMNEKCFYVEYFVEIANCFKPTHQGWGSVDSSNQLGSRKKGFFWF